MRPHDLERSILFKAIKSDESDKFVSRLFSTSPVKQQSLERQCETVCRQGSFNYRAFVVKRPLIDLHLTSHAASWGLAMGKNANHGAGYARGSLRASRKPQRARVRLTCVSGFGGTDLVGNEQDSRAGLVVLEIQVFRWKPRGSCL
jgi:hypothetical protein